MSIISKIFGDPNAREIKKAKLRVERINNLEADIKKLSDKQLKSKTSEFMDRIDHKKLESSLDAILEEAFAVVREASRRVLEQRHFDVQLIGGVVLHGGAIAEMRTGEGKTLVATAPLYLNALSKKGAHLVTVNDYLAKLHAGWMGQIYHFLGLSTGVISHESAFVYDPEYTDDKHEDERLRHLRPVERKEAYSADITYGTNNEFGFDYLRDNMVQEVSQIVQRDLNYVIVDEVDSILIDEARTPLIISQQANKSTDRYYTFAKIAKSLDPKTDYTTDEKQKAVSVTEVGITKIEKSLGVDNIYEAGRIEDVHHVEAALKAEALFVKDKDYVVSEDGEIVIVDEFTGRMLPGRRYSEGLHQAIEAKEGVQIQAESQTLATITFQNLFRLYNKLAGMTGTAMTEAEEFAKIYSLEVTQIPTHRPMIRKDLPDKIYKSELGKFGAVVQEVKERHNSGQAVLIGTVSIEKNEILSNMLKKAGVDHTILNAKNNEAEAGIIAEAGRVGAVTLATNIAGRGTDIVLDEKVKELGGLHVLGTERHESRRIDNQLRGRAGRQGDPGSSQFYVSVEDDLMRVFGGDRIGSLMNTLNVPEDTPIENKMISRTLETAQKRVEGHNFDIRKHLVEYDDVMNSQREIIYKKRRRFLESKDLKPDIFEALEQEFGLIVQSHTNSSTSMIDLEEVAKSARNIIPVPTDWSQNITSKLPQDIVDSLLDISKQMYDQRIEEFGDDTMQLINRLVCFKVIDSAWLQHLETMDHLRDGIGLRGYGQRDPLVEYKSEAFRLFTQLQNGINSEIATTIFKVQIQPQSVVEAPTTEITEGAKRATSQVTEAEVVKTKRSSSSRSNSKVEATRSVKLDPMRRSKKSKRKKKKRR
ncbi:MAG: preprotein translocase subunit SecA [Patescibacteria group bacterium]|jgi:preprotein translocase subunit SecA|nr:preprotein translocase subunit SecA [Patescibacteria group bacterium]